MKLFVNSFYSTLIGPTFNTPVFYDATSDNSVANVQDPRLFNNLSVPDIGGGWASGDWGNIRQLNYALTHYKTVVGSAAEINQYLGEIKFFRANEFFNKAKNFGDVPWLSKNLNITDLDLLYAVRDPMQMVMDSVIADLQFAAANIPVPSGVEVGRLNKYAALTMLARVSLFEGTYLKYRGLAGWQNYLTLAATTSQTIMSSGLYQIVRTNPTYFLTGYPLYYKAQFITEDLTANKECILPRIFITNLVTTRQSGSAFGAGYGVSKDLVEDFLCTDGLPIALSPLYKGDDSSYMEMTNRDPRLRNMMDNKVNPFYINKGVLQVYPVSPITVSVCPTGYLLSKFRDPNPATNEANATSYDWNIFRYAEVLLIFAESKAESGTITQADLDASINLIRARLDEPANFTMGRLSLNPPADPNAIVNGHDRYGYPTPLSPLVYSSLESR
jgi:hypothetical protein